MQKSNLLPNAFQGFLSFSATAQKRGTTQAQIRSHALRGRQGLCFMPHGLLGNEVLGLYSFMITGIVQDRETKAS